MAVIEREETVEVFRFFRSPLDRTKIDYLDKETRVAAAFAPDSFYKVAEARDETVVAYAEQRPARYIAHARRFAIQLDELRRRLLTVEKSAIQDATTSGILSEEGAADLTARIDRDMADLGADEEA